MGLAIAMLLIYLVVVWLVFFKFRVAKFNIIWGLVSFWVVLHLGLVFLIGTRFGQPYTEDARIIRQSVQISPHLSKNALLTEVLVKNNQHVRKGDPLFRFDDRIFRYRVNQLAAEVAAAEQNVLILKANLDLATGKVDQTKAEQKYAREQFTRFKKLVPKGAASERQLENWEAQLRERTAELAESRAEKESAQLAYDSRIDGVNTTVAQKQAELDQARYYLEHTTIYAPGDGFITNLQARPGMNVGHFRVGAIASFVEDKDPYLLGNFRQYWLKFVQPGQPVEIALDMYPGQIFKGKLESVWWATGQGQMMPRGRLPDFNQPTPKGFFAAQIRFEDADRLLLPAGAQGSAAIYTDVGKHFVFLRKIGIRTYTWLNWLRPIPF